MNKDEVRTYVEKLFLYYYQKPGDPSHINTVVEFVINGKLTFDNAPLYIESLANQFPEYYILKNTSPSHILQKNQQLQHTQPLPQNNINQTNLNNNNNNNVNSSSSSSSSKSNSNNGTSSNEMKYWDYDSNQFLKEKIKQELNTDNARIYVNEVYMIYTGKLGDPASTNYLVTSLVDGSLSCQQAEFHVRFSKEAKQYSVVLKKKEDKKKVAEEYVYELYKVYFGKDYICSPEDLLHYVKIITGPNPNYQEVEDEIKEKGLLNINIPKKPLFFKKQ